MCRHPRHNGAVPDAVTVDSAFRCSVASREDQEPIAGTAPTEPELLLVEHPGPWGSKAVEESRLPAPVKEWLGSLDGIRVQLVRRPGGRAAPGIRVFHAVAEDDRFSVSSGVVEDVADLPALDLADLAPYDGPLWLVCTNGRRDRCCAEVGRPIAAALAARWPEATWETTHLGGHRFSGTLLALPSGHALGRLDAASAVDACAVLEAGEVPVPFSRGRAGLAPEAQVLDLHLLAGGSPDVDVVEVPGERRASCRDDLVKTTVSYRVRPRS